MFPTLQNIVWKEGRQLRREDNDTLGVSETCSPIVYTFVFYNFFLLFLPRKMFAPLISLIFPCLWKQEIIFSSECTFFRHFNHLLWMMALQITTTKNELCRPKTGICKYFLISLPLFSSRKVNSKLVKHHLLQYISNGIEIVADVTTFLLFFHLSWGVFPFTCQHINSFSVTFSLLIIMKYWLQECRCQTWLSRKLSYFTSVKTEHVFYQLWVINPN